jgi:superfamily II DNA or RNA helicase
MYLFITTVNKLILAELATGTGKSLMIALIALYLKIFLNKKVLVLVPSEVLKLD